VDTLELARIHEQAATAVMTSSRTRAANKKADFFFTNANISIEETHFSAKQGRERLDRLKVALDLRTDELALTNRQLQRGIVRRKVMEDAAQKNGIHYRKCLQESVELQNRLKQLTRRVLVSQENERKKISHELQDEIAQTLLGINVRLRNLREQAKTGARGLKKEISSTQQLVVKSSQSVRRVAREFGKS
jgi:signal transduction histidine kinase